MVSAVGIGREAIWGALLAGESGMGPITPFDTDGFGDNIVAECSAFEPKDFMDRKAAQRTGRFAQMAPAAA